MARGGGQVHESGHVSDTRLLFLAPVGTARVGPWCGELSQPGADLPEKRYSIEPAVKIVLLEEAQRRFVAEDTWWRENRDVKALFIEEFSAVLGQISSMPEVGQRGPKL